MMAGVTDSTRTGQWQSGSITDGPSEGLLHGPVDQWVDELTELATAYGVDTFVLWSEGDQYRRFAEDVVPRVRQQVITFEQGLTLCHSVEDYARLAGRR